MIVLQVVAFWALQACHAFSTLPIHHTITRLRAGSEIPPEVPEAPPELPETAPVLILVDVFSPYHGSYLQFKAQEHGIRTISLLGNYLCDYLILQGEEEAEAARIPLQDPVELLEAVRQADSVTVHCESDSGLRDTEYLRQVLGLEGDKPLVSEARRDKFLMHEAIQKAGLASVEQMRCSSLDESMQFTQSLLQKGKRVVIKPHRGVASESVHLVTDLNQVEAAWTTITESSVFGERERHDSVLIQEFLEGPEYAIDTVSRRGEHKVAAVWKYDKRPVENGPSLVYYQTKIAQNDENVDAMCDYVEKVLDALGICEGMTHTEVIVTPDRGPGLVEVNCRQHNMDFAALTMNCLHSSALDMFIIANFFSEQWAEVPKRPMEQHAHGCMVHLVSSVAGAVTEVNHLEELRSMDSVLNFEIYPDFTPGNIIEPTTDIRTDAGWVQLVHEDEEKLNQDYQRIVELMPTMFDVSKEATVLQKTLGDEFEE